MPAIRRHREGCPRKYRWAGQFFATGIAPGTAVFSRSGRRRSTPGSGGNLALTCGTSSTPSVMILTTGCTMNVEAAAESPVILMLQPQSGLGQQVKASQITVRPDIPLRDFKDLSETSPSAPSFPRGARSSPAPAPWRAGRDRRQSRRRFHARPEPARGCPAVFAAQPLLRIRQVFEDGDVDCPQGEARLSAGGGDPGLDPSEAEI